jgi:hypothetical protein
VILIVTEMKKYYYTYYSYEEWGRGYIGSRKSKVSPEQDISYFGSYKDKTFHPTQKIILTQHNTREEALAAEMRLHEFYDVANNSHFANLSKLTSVRFYVSEEIARECGRKIGNKTKELGVGIHALTKEDLGKAGNRGGKKTKELNRGIFSQTKEEMIKHSKMGGNKTKELGVGIFGLTKEERIAAGKKGGKKAGKIRAEKTAREFVLMDPQGNIHKERNLDRFCKKYNLDRSSISRVLNGKYKHSQGWTKPIDNALTDILFS